ncbi:MAG TPA: ATP-binding protein, partial [Caulobacteraceae bacterium]|nr:ATP-binding protein [Caulobacteraceae bacterium]
MILKQLADVTLADIEALVTSSVPEGRTLEYKAQFPGARDRDKQEFLHDVIAFANSDGGDLIFGVEARAGVATAVPGALLTDPDAAILQLEGMLSSSVEPRIAGLRTHPIEVTPGAHVIVMRVPPSFAAPHAARNGTTRRFYSRDSRGKREMDVHELRVAFGASEGLVPRLVALHEDAVRAVIDGELPFQLEGGPRAILSIMPMSALREPRELELDHATAVHPVLDQGTDWSHSLE